MKNSFFLGILLLFMWSCSSNLVHTWNIDEFKIIKGNGQKTSSTNIGTITFNKDGSGTKDIAYSIFGENYTDKIPFTWDKQEGYIVLSTSEKGVKSRLAKAWIMVKDGPKKQVWKSTNGKKNVLVLKLSRK